MESMTSDAPNWSSLKNAIVVCGHAVYHGGPKLRPAQLAELDKYWFLQPFQQGEGIDYISHIQRGVMMAAEDETSLLIFSGGQTRAPYILSEAQGYHDVACAFTFWGKKDVRSRTTTEEFSRDSMDNLLFSIARFYECVGALPDIVTVISWGFKEARFTHHAWSIRWPKSRFRFEGVGAPEALEKAEEAEAETLRKFSEDASGCGRGEDGLYTKKIARNPYRRQNGYAISCPCMSAILAWTDTNQVSEKDVPWS